MVVGMAVNVVWRLFFCFDYAGLQDVHEIIPAFLLSLLTYIVVSKLTQHRVPEAEHLELVFGKS